MSKTLIIGDVHLKFELILSTADYLLERDGSITRVVFTGDYCDDWYAKDYKLMNDLSMFSEWVAKKRASGLSIDLLIGNHDYQYLIGVPGPGTQIDLAPFIRETLEPLGLQMATVVDGYLVTHAGVTQEWAEYHLSNVSDVEDIAKQLNMLYEKPDRGIEAFDSVGPGRGGTSVPSPIWTDRYELEDDPLAEIDQIVGHTPTFTCSEFVSYSEELLWFCDTFSTRIDESLIGDRSVLVVENGHIEVVETMGHLDFSPNVDEYDSFF